MEEKDPVIAGVEMTFNDCIIVINVGKEDLTSFIHTLVDEGVLTPRAAEQFLTSDPEKENHI